jgi:hypothetical protein
MSENQVAIFEGNSRPNYTPYAQKWRKKMQIQGQIK